MDKNGRDESGLHLGNLEKVSPPFIKFMANITIPLSVNEYHIAIFEF